MAGRYMMVVAGLVMASVVAGCGPSPMVEFSTPRIMMHVEADRLTSVEPISGDVEVEQLDEMMARVHGTGVVRINQLHTVDVKSDGIRVHGTEVQSQGVMRDVFVEKDKVSGGVHVDRITK